MIPTTTLPAAPLATLEISDRRLPARMVATRLRADLRGNAVLPAVPRRRLRAAMLLLMLAAPIVSATRHRHA